MTNPLEPPEGAKEADEEDKRWAVRLTEYARTDVDAAAAYLSDWVGDERADAWQDGLLEAAGKLARFPTSHGTIPELALFRETIRQFLYTASRRRRRGGSAWRVLCCARTNRMGQSFTFCTCGMGTGSNHAGRSAGNGTVPLETPACTAGDTGVSVSRQIGPRGLRQASVRR